jgi:Lipocalin-like domain
MSYEARSDDGHRVSYPLSDDAKGYILYTADGYMSAQIMQATATQSSPHAPRAVHNAPLAFGTGLLTAVLVWERA